MAQRGKTACPAPRASLRPTEQNLRGTWQPRPRSSDASSLGRYPGHALAAATVSRDPLFHSWQTLSEVGQRRREAPRELLGLPGEAPTRRLVESWEMQSPRWSSSSRLLEERSGVQSSRRSGGGRLCLEPREHAWILAAADCRFEVLEKLLKEDPGLLTMVDPITGYSLLHWLAKHGHHEELVKMHDLALRLGLAFDVNDSGSCGFTPLHLAAWQGHDMVIKVLVGALGADISRRDYSGHRACYYLRPNASQSLRELTSGVETEVAQESELYNASNGSGISGWALRRTPSAGRAKSIGTQPREVAAQVKENSTPRRKRVRGNSFLRQLFPFFHKR